MVHIPDWVHPSSNGMH
ncbi:hypothetical protein CFP56_013589 [Quercus suber]|uniref:Uncharacterized protein n=1 Tax=Quercus suber TaxID=58331 RepID=A0AAW0KV65_QUESU